MSLKRIRRGVSLVLALALFASGSSFAADRNLDARQPVGPLDPPRGQTVTATFPGPLDAFQINLVIQNGSGMGVDTFVLDGSTATAGAILWDDMGSFSGPATVILVGVDTEVVMGTFTGFDDGETVQFSSVDPDFSGGDPSVAVGQLAGCTFSIQAGAVLGQGTFEVVGQDVVATVELGTIAVDAASWGRTKASYR